MTSHAFDLLCGLVLADGRRWGDAAVPAQRADARAILDLDGPLLHYITRPRGMSKTTDLGAVVIAMLLEQLSTADRGYGFAADRDQARILVDSIAGFVLRTPEIRGALRVDNFVVTNPRTGALFEAMASDESSSWGLQLKFAVLDEFAQWKSTPGPRRLWESVFSALPKEHARLVVLTTAGDPAHWSRAVLDQAKKRPKRWRVAETPGPCPWIPVEDLEEQRAMLPESAYARLHLNRWTATEDRLVLVDDLRACVTLDGPRGRIPGFRYAIGVDIGLKHDRTVAAVCSMEERRAGEPGVPVSLERMGVWQGTKANPVDLDDVEAWLVTACEEFGHPQVRVDPYQAAQLMRRLSKRGVAVDEFAFTTQSISRLALRLLQLVRDHALALPDDVELLDELANLRLLEPSPGVYRIDHDPDKHDDRAIALALAASALADGPSMFFDASSWAGWRKQSITGDLLTRQF